MDGLYSRRGDGHGREKASYLRVESRVLVVVVAAVVGVEEGEPGHACAE
jgi:hypothetical protein